MSEYLSRLATRARGSNETQPLRPFVRSTSPIAAHDQRIGLTVAEGFEALGALPDQTRSASTAGSLGEFETGGRPGVEPGNGRGEMTVQRKVAASAVGQAGPSSHLASAGPAVSGARLPAPAAAEVKTQSAELAAKSSAAVRAADDQDQFNEPLASRDTTRVEPDSIFPKMSAGGDESPVSAAKSARTDNRRSDSLGTQAAIRHVGEVIGHTRSARRASEIDSAGLEPKLSGFVDRVGTWPGGSTGSSAAADESPRIMIGRINVEVVASAAQQVATAPRPRPLTAASVSVIGPLGGVRPNMRLSLGHR